MNKNFVLNESFEKETADTAKRMRVNMLKMMKHAGANGAHIGGGFSAAEILACLYHGIMNVGPDMVTDPSRDRFILSKGHTALALYSALYEAGFMTEEELMSFEDNGSEFATHLSKNPAKGIEVSSGSLGLGLSYGAGCALIGKRDELTYDCYVLLGDGECNEGSVWEAAQSAAKYQLDNLVAIVDCNRQSLDGFTVDSMPIFDIGMVFRGFGWDVVEIDGHSVKEIASALCGVERNGKPTAVIAHTSKGKGVSFMEDTVGWHHASLSEEQYNSAMEELR